MEFPINESPNKLPIVAMGLAAAFGLPFAVRFTNIPLVAVTAGLLGCYLFFVLRTKRKNQSAHQKWMERNGVAAVSVAKAKRLLESSEDHQIKLLVQHEDWPPSFFVETPKAFLVDQAGNWFWVRIRFPLQLYLFAASTSRRGFHVENTNGCAIPSIASTPLIPSIPAKSNENADSYA